ncbi:MAG: nucleotidyltransferase family protein, partial [Litorilinea sp.]
QWNREVDLIEDLVDLGSFRLLPLVYHNLRQTIDADGQEVPHLGRLRGIHRRTWVENQVRFRACVQILEDFEAAGIPTLLLKGAALVACHYSDFGVRPMSDFDVLVPKAQVQAAIDVLAARGWHPEDRGLDRLTPTYFSVRHSQGFAGPGEQYLDLHWHVLNTSLDTAVDDQFWAGAVPAQIHQHTTRALNPTDQLLHVCVHGAAWSSTPPVRWAADAGVILQHHAPTIDWARLVRMAQTGWCTLQLHVTLSYLAGTLGLPIPAATLDALAQIPVRDEARQLFAVSTRRSLGLGHLPVLWHRHRHYRAQMQVRRAQGAPAPRPLGFARYVQHFLGLDSLWAVGAWLVTRMVKRLGILWRNQNADASSA